MELVLALLVLLALVAIASRFFGQARNSAPSDAAEQLRVVMRSRFERKRLMSRREFDAFRAIEADLVRFGPGYRLMAQTSLGEILSSPDEAGFRSINAKRVDMLVIDTFGLPVLAIEHQGGGHYQGDAPARDAVKREALRKAGVEMLELFDHHRPEEMCRLVAEAIQRGKPLMAAGGRQAR